MRYRQVALACALLAVPLLAGCVPDQPTAARRLGLEVNEPPGQTYDQALAMARGAGASSVQLTLPWSTLEPTRGALDVTSLAMALDYYASLGLEVTLSIPAVDTLARFFPADLASYAIDDPVVLTRMEEMLEEVLAVAGPELHYLSIANEFDLYLLFNPQDRANWEGMERFVRHAVEYVHELRPDVAVGVSIAHGTLGFAPISPIVEVCDVLFATYYFSQDDYEDGPELHVAGAFADLVAAARGRPLVMKEVGYPTGALTQGSEAGQVAFLRAVFSAWDVHADAIPTLFLSRLYDGVPLECAARAAGYGNPDPAFIEFLCTTGLRKLENVPKQAWAELLALTAARNL